MPVDNPGRDRQTQTGAFLLGAEKRIEQSILRFRRNARAIVLDLDDHGVGGLAFKGQSGLAGAQRDRPLPLDALGCVLHQVDENFL